MAHRRVCHRIGVWRVIGGHQFRYFIPLSDKRRYLWRNHFGTGNFVAGNFRGAGFCSQQILSTYYQRYLWRQRLPARIIYPNYAYYKQCGIAQCR